MKGHTYFETDYKILIRQLCLVDAISKKSSHDYQSALLLLTATASMDSVTVLLPADTA